MDDDGYDVSDECYVGSYRCYGNVCGALKVRREERETFVIGSMKVKNCVTLFN